MPVAMDFHVVHDRLASPLPTKLGDGPPSKGTVPQAKQKAVNESIATNISHMGDRPQFGAVVKLRVKVWYPVKDRRIRHSLSAGIHTLSISVYEPIAIHILPVSKFWGTGVVRGRSCTP